MIWPREGVVDVDVVQALSYPLDIFMEVTYGKPLWIKKFYQNPYMQTGPTNQPTKSENIK